MRWPTDSYKLTRLSLREGLLLLEAVGWLLLSHAAIFLIKFQRITKWMETKARTASGNSAAMSDVSWAMRVIVPRTPWRNGCLVQTLATAIMLRQRGVSSTLYLGVAKDSSNLMAHSWLSCGNAVMIGERRHFHTISTFNVGSKVSA